MINENIVFHSILTT